MSRPLTSTGVTGSFTAPSGVGEAPRVVLVPRPRGEVCTSANVGLRGVPGVGVVFIIGVLGVGVVFIKGVSADPTLTLPLCAGEVF